jgi:hypothetical protein
LQNEPNFHLGNHGLGNSPCWLRNVSAAYFPGSNRTAEAVRRALPALLKLQRYEARAVARRDQAIRNYAAKRTQFLSEKS